jgi:hypothetical protein
MRIPGVTAATKIGPDAPTLVSVTNIGTNREFNNGAVDVAFTAATTTPSNPAVSYKVEVSNGITATGATSPIRVQNLANSNLTFTVRGINVLGIEGPTSATSSSTTITTVPDKPDIGIASSGNGVAYVPFSLSSTGGRDIVEYIVSGNPSGSAVGASSPVTVSSLANGSDYTFTVVARNANGTSLASNPSNVVRPTAPVITPPPPPTETYYCYTSTCITSNGSSQYSVVPTLSFITNFTNNSDSSSTSFGVTTNTIVRCATSQGAAANNAKQSPCEGAVIADPPEGAGCTDPNTTEFGDCPAAGSSLWVTTAGTPLYRCNGTFYQSYAIQTAYQSYTEYNCAGNVVSSGRSPTCSQEIIYDNEQLDGQCGYTAPSYTYADTGDYPSTGGTTTTTTTGTGGSLPLGNGQSYGNPGVTVYTTSDLDTAVDILIANPNYTELDFNVDTDQWVITVPNSSSGGFGGGGCFAFGTKVTMADGSLKNIEDLVLGDELRTFNIPGAPDTDDYEYWLKPDAWTTNSTEDFTITTTKVTHHRVGPYSFHFNINRKIKVTHEHLIFINRSGSYSFIPVRKIKVGDKLVTESLEEIEVFSITLEGSAIDTVELDVEDRDFYFADGILAHNLRAPIESSAFK